MAEDTAVNMLLYGTDRPTAAPRRLDVGRWSFELRDAGLATVWLDGVEAVRGIDLKVYLLGLRNPWRFAFDDGLIYVVGGEDEAGDEHQPSRPSSSNSP